MIERLPGNVHNSCVSYVPCIDYSMLTILLEFGSPRPSELVLTHKWGRWTQGVTSAAAGGLFEAPTPQPSPPRWERVATLHCRLAGERAICQAQLPRAAVALLPCPGLPSNAPLGLKTRSPCDSPYPLCPAEKMWDTISSAEGSFPSSFESQ